MGGCRNSGRKPLQASFQAYSATPPARDQPEWYDLGFCTMARSEKGAEIPGTKTPFLLHVPKCTHIVESKQVAGINRTHSGFPCGDAGS